MATNFYLDNRTDRHGDAPIRVSVSIRGSRLVTSCGFKIAPAKWDGNKQQCRKGSSSANGTTWNQINTALSKIASHFAAYEAECLAVGFVPDADTLKVEFARTLGRKEARATAAPPLGFFDYYDTFTQAVGQANQWTRGTHQKFATLRSHLMDFSPTLTFDDLNEDGLNAFVTFLRKKYDVRNTTVTKQLAAFKSFLRWATAKGHNANQAFQSFSPRLKIAPKKVVFLDWEELMRVYSYDVPANGTSVTLRDAAGNEYVKVMRDASAIAKTRDVFCFCCFTSLRYSDVSNLKRADIADGAITLTTIKTADTLTIELNKYALAILAKYADRTDLGEYALPHITNQRMNIYLKDLCELCGINKPITQTYYKGGERFEETAPKYAMIGTHCGRRTFVCNALMLGIPPQIVMKWTGHSDYKAMKPYIDVTSAAKADAMSKFNSI